MQMSEIRIGSEYLTGNGGRIKVLAINAVNKMSGNRDCVEAVYWSESHNEWSKKRYTIKPSNIQGPWGSKDQGPPQETPKQEPVKAPPPKAEPKQEQEEDPKAPAWSEELLELVVVKSRDPEGAVQVAARMATLEQENARLQAEVEILRGKLAELALAGADDL